MPKIVGRIARRLAPARGYLITGYCVLALVIMASWVWAADHAVQVVSRATVVFILGFVEIMFLIAAGIAVLAAILLDAPKPGDPEP